MRLKFILGIAAILLRINFIYSQNNKLNTIVEVNDFSGTKKEFLKKLESITPLTFSYTNALNLDEKVTIIKQKKSIKEFLDIIFPNNTVKYQIKENKVLLITQNYLLKTPIKYTVCGYVFDSLTGEKLAGVFISLKEISKGTLTNSYGFYSFTVPKGIYEASYSLPNFSSKKKEITLDDNISLNITLSQAIKILSDTSILNENAQSTEKEMESEYLIRIKTLPIIPNNNFEIIKDFKTINEIEIKLQTEGANGMYVRGGGPDQNLLLLDGTTIYNANHLFSFLPLFNTDATSNINLIKGGFPARYGEKLSSVLDVHMKEGDNKKFKIEGETGIIFSKLTVEGPIKKNKSSFIISGRKTYIDALAEPFMKSDQKIGYNFYDLNAKINYQFSENNQIYLSFYSGRDKYSYNNKYFYTIDSTTTINKREITWGNTTLALRWNCKLSNKLFAIATLTYNKYKLLNNSSEEDDYVDPQEIYVSNNNYNSGIDDLTGKFDFDYVPSPNHYIKFGIQTTRHVFSPLFYIYQFKSNDSSQNIDTTIGNNKIYNYEHTVYAEDEINFCKKIKTNIGLRYTIFDVTSKLYNSIEPRIAITYFASEHLSLKAAYDKMNQNILLLSNTSIDFPNDLWVPATEKIKPISSCQYSLGVDYSINGRMNISIDGFYKVLKNVLEYKSNTDYTDIAWVSNWDWQNNVEQGKGWSYGTDILFQKVMGKTTGWLSYTLSWSERLFDSINSGEKFSYRYDIRHNIVLGVHHKFNNKIDVGFVWSFVSGIKATLAAITYMSAFNVSDPYYINAGGVNGYRMPAYSSLDLSLNFHKQKKWGERIWSICLYNAYNRMNPFYMYYQEEYQNGLYVNVLKKVCISPIMPNISYIFKIN